MTMKVMTFNLRVHVESDGVNAWPHRYHAAAQAILAHGADIVCTQEGRLPMLRDLEGLLPDYAWVGIGRMGGQDDEYCAVFYNKTKLRAVEEGHFGLSEHPEQLGYMSWNTACPRMCTWVRLQAANSEEWMVFNTHLDHISEEAQRKGMALIRSRMADILSSAGVPSILTGDFNVGPDHPVIQELDEAGYVNAFSILPGGAQGVDATFHDFKGGLTGETIDYIYVTPGVTVEHVEVDRGQYDNRYPSDHYPVVASITRH